MNLRLNLINEEFEIHKNVTRVETKWMSGYQYMVITFQDGTYKIVPMSKIDTHEITL